MFDIKKPFYLQFSTGLCTAGAGPGILKQLKPGVVDCASYLRPLDTKRSESLRIAWATEKIFFPLKQQQQQQQQHPRVEAPSVKSLLLKQEDPSSNPQHPCESRA